MHTYFSKKIVATTLFVVGLLTLVSFLPKQASAAAVCPPLSESLNGAPSGVPSDWCSYVCPPVFPQYLLEKDKEMANKDIDNYVAGSSTCGHITGTGDYDDGYWAGSGRSINRAKDDFVNSINEYVSHLGFSGARQVTTSDLTDNWCLPCDKHLLAKAAEPVDTDAFTYQCPKQVNTLFKNNTLPGSIPESMITSDWCRACFIDSTQFANDPSGGSCKSSNPFTEELERILKSRGIISHGRSDFITILESSMKGDGTGDVTNPGWCSPCARATRTASTVTPGEQGNPGGYTPSTSNGTFDPLRNPLGEGGIYTISDLISRILTIIATIAIPFAVLAVLWSGFLFIKAQGNPEEIKKASYTLLFTVVGTGLLFAGPKLATAIADTVKEIFQDDLSFQSTTILEQTHIVTLPVSTNRSSLS